MSLKTLLALAVLCAVVLREVESITYNATVEEGIDQQRKKWCSGSSYHRVKFQPEDNQYFEKHCGSNASSTFNDEDEELGPRAVLGSRKELRCMHSRERQGYMNALNSMKRSIVGSVSEYDNFVLRHDGRRARPAHFCPGFMGWHREFLTGFERSVRSYCPSCMIPYWDSRLDRRLGGDPADSVYFSDVLMGNARGTVTTGFAANWPIGGSYCRSIGNRLRRNLDSNVASFYDDSDVNPADNVRNYRSYSYPWNSQPEFSHGYVHNSFGQGSHMLDIMCSPADPIFFQHHAFVDLIFERARVSMRSNNGLIYPSTNPRDLPPNFDDSNRHVQNDCARDAPMLPFDGLVNNYGLVSQRYTDDIYDYERSPADVNCRSDSDCCANGNTDFLWCNSGLCTSKVRNGGRISPRYPARACYCPSSAPRIVGSTCSCA